MNQEIRDKVARANDRCGTFTLVHACMSFEGIIIRFTLLRSTENAWSLDLSILPFGFGMLIPGKSVILPQSTHFIST